MVHQEYTYLVRLPHGEISNNGFDLKIVEALGQYIGIRHILLLLFSFGGIFPLNSFTTNRETRWTF